MADPAPTTTQTMVTTIGATVAKNLLMIAGASLASHGLIAGSGVETFVSLGMVLIGAVWSFWNSYGRAIMVAKLQVWKAKAEAQAEAMRKANVPAPTNAQIAETIPDPKVTAEVVKAATAAAFALMIVLAASPALAQVKRPLTGNIINDIRQANDPARATAAADDTSGLQKKLLQALAKPFQMISSMIGDDVDNAILLATAVPGIQDGHGQQCWIALRNFTAVAKAHPLPLTGQIATDLQAIRLQAIAANQLCSNIHCTQMFTDYTAMAQAVAQDALGAIGALGAKAVPSLSDACHMIPQISLVDPLIPAPPAPVINPVGWAAEQPVPVPAPKPPQ